MEKKNQKTSLENFKHKALTKKQEKQIKGGNVVIEEIINL